MPRTLPKDEFFQDNLIYTGTERGLGVGNLSLRLINQVYDYLESKGQTKIISLAPEVL